MRDEATSSRPVSVVERVDRILSACADVEYSLGLTELSRAADLPKATTHRLAEQLVRAGLIERDGRRYRLGLKLFELGNRVAVRSARNEILPYLEELRTVTGATVHFAVRDGGSVLYVEKLRGHNGVDQGSRLAGRLPLHATATGKVLVAFSPPDVARAMASSELERVTPYTIVVPSVLLEQFDQIRRRGWGAEREECVLGWASVAAPVFGLGGALVGAISATLPSAGLIEESVATRVVATTRAASRAIGRGLGPSSHGAGP